MKAIEAIETIGPSLAFCPLPESRIGTGVGMFQWLMIRHGGSQLHSSVNSPPAQGRLSSVILQASVIDAFIGPGLPM